MKIFSLIICYLIIESDPIIENIQLDYLLLNSGGDLVVKEVTQIDRQWSRPQIYHAPVTASYLGASGSWAVPSYIHTHSLSPILGFLTWYLGSRTVSWKAVTPLGITT